MITLKLQLQVIPDKIMGNKIICLTLIIHTCWCGIEITHLCISVPWTESRSWNRCSLKFLPCSNWKGFSKTPSRIGNVNLKTSVKNIIVVIIHILHHSQTSHMSVNCLDTILIGIWSSWLPVRRLYCCWRLCYIWRGPMRRVSVYLPCLWTGSILLIISWLWSGSWWISWFKKYTCNKLVTCNKCASTTCIFLLRWWGYVWIFWRWLLLLLL